MRTLRHSATVRAILLTTILSLIWLQTCPAWADIARQNRAETQAAQMRLEAARRASRLAPGLTQTPGPALRAKIDAQQRAAQTAKAQRVPAVRLMSALQMKQAFGRGPLRNPYFNGTLPWQKSFRDVNVCNGNLFKSFTDVQVAPARGAGLVLQRTYNSNDARVGPFGVGWTHAYDIRIQEAADVKAQAGNAAAVPMNSPQDDGDATLNEVPRTDFFGAKHSYHRDADGLYSPPDYLYDEMSSDYNTSLANGPAKVEDDTEKGMDGTIKHYVRVVTLADGSSGNERACDYIEDRYGNTTTLTYAQSYVQSDGSTRQLLTQVKDPTGRTLTFDWTNFGTPAAPAYRITEVDAPVDSTTGTSVYRVIYSYYGANDPAAGGASYQLKSVTLDPDGLSRTTTYTYTSCSEVYYDSGGNAQSATEYGLLASVSDPLGHTVSYTYSARAYVCEGDEGDDGPVGYVVPKPTGTVWVATVTEPAGIDTNGTPRSQTWTIIPVDIHTQGRFAVVISNDSGAYLYLEVDSQLRFYDYRGEPMSSGRVFEYSTDGANNVAAARSFEISKAVPGGSEFNGGPIAFEGASDGQPESWAPTYNTTVCSYGPHGNVLTQTTVPFSSSHPFPVSDQTLTTYYNASQYFQKQSVTDGNGHTTVMGIGTDTAGMPGDPDPSSGDRGQTLWVRDAGYDDSASPSYHRQFSYTYNQYGQKTSETNLNGVVTQYYYGGDGSSYDLADTDADDVGNLIAVVQDPGGSGHLSRTTVMHYDIMGRVLQSTDPAGQTSLFSYNSLGQPLTVATPAHGGAPAETIAYVYDTNGRTLSVTDNRGTTIMAYEAGCDRVHSVTDPVTGPVSYTYRAEGERLTMTLPGQSTWSYTYTDANPGLVNSVPYPNLNGHFHTDFLGGPTVPIAGRYVLGKVDDLDSLTLMLDHITDDQGRRVDYMMDWQNRLLSAWNNETFDGSGMTKSFQQSANYFDSPTYSPWDYPQFDTHYWLGNSHTTWHQQTNGTWQDSLFHQNAYTYDNAGQRTTNTISSQQLDANGHPQVDGSNNPILTSRTETYGYDALNRLKAVDYGDGQTQGYTFDAMGNRLGKTDSAAGSTSYAFDAANRLTTVNGQAVTCDADGNTLTDASGRTSTWDSQNRMTGCTKGGVTSTYTYGADGLRRTSTANANTPNATTTYYVYDGTMMVREMQKNAQGTLQSTATYLCGPRGPEYRRDDVHSEGTYMGAPAGTVRWYVYDGLGSVVGEVDPSGSMTSSGTYDVYGAKRAGGTGTATSRQGFVGSLGHISDDTGLVYMRARYYDPQTGRFVSRDPALNGSNWFAYCADDPVNKTDSTGKTLELLAAGADDAVQRTEDAVQGTVIEGKVEQLALYIESRMELMDAMFEGCFEDSRGGQLVWKYANQYGESTFRFDIKDGAIDLAGSARNAFNLTGTGHAWAFTQAIEDIVQAGFG